MQSRVTSQTEIHPQTLPHKITTNAAHHIPTVRRMSGQDQSMLMYISPFLDLRQRRALHVDVELARAAVVGETVPRPPARATGELSIAVRRRGEEGKGVGGVAAVAEAAGEVGAEAVEEEAAGGLGAHVGGAHDVVLAAGADAVVVHMELRWLKWLIISCVSSLSSSELFMAIAIF